MRRFALTITGLALSFGAVAQAPVPSQVEQAARTYITRAALEAPIRFLASDLLEGRGPGTRADQMTRLYLQTRLEGMGYRGAFANGAWQQPFDIVGIRSQLPQQWSFRGKSARVDLALRDDYIGVSGLQRDVIGRPPGWGKQQHEQWELKQYHQPSDKLDGTWNFEGMIEDAQLDFAAGWLITQADAMPTWKPGDEFEAARKRELAAVGGN